MKVNRVFYCILLTLLMNLISVNSFSVMTFGKFSKDDNLDKKLNDIGNKITNLETRLGKSYDLVKKQLLEKKGGPSKIEVFPVGIYKQIANGINYMIITAVKDLENKKIELFNAIVFSPFLYPSSASQEPKITLAEKIGNEFKISNENDQKDLNLIKNYLKEQLELTNSVLERINSIMKTKGEINNEIIYLINCDIIHDKDMFINRYYILSLDKKGLSVSKVFDFQNN